MGWGQELHAQHLALDWLCIKGWLAQDTRATAIVIFPDTSHKLFFADREEMALVTIQWLSKS